MATITITVEVELSGVGGGWTALSADLMVAEEVVVSYGIQGTGPHDRVASTGTMRFALANDNGNSAGLQGRYSPGHANALAGFDLGIRCRLVVTHLGVAYHKFVGTVEEVAPSTGKYRRRVSRILVVDWFDEAARAKLTGLGVQTSKRADELMTSVVAEVAKQPNATSYETGSETYVYALVDTVMAMTEFTKISASEFGFTYMKGGVSTGGILKFENRTTRISNATAAATFTDDDIYELEAVARQRSRILNRIEVETHPRTADSSATGVLFSLNSTTFVRASQIISLSGEYSDPTLRASKISGIEMVSPASTTDFTANASSDGTGTSLTASFTVSATYAGSVVFYTITNTSTQDGWLTKLQARGKGLYDYQPVSAIANSTASVDSYGRRLLQFDMPYQNSGSIGDQAATYLKDNYSDSDDTQEYNLTVMGRSDALMTQCLAREVSDRVEVTETMSGLSAAPFWIQGVNLRIVAGPHVFSKWLLAKADTRAYWLLGVAGRSELGVTTYLGPF